MVLRENKWSVFLTRFADHVSMGAYKKTNYSTWRDMKSWRGAEIWIKSGKYTVEDIDCPYNYHDFVANDGSFGQFINDVWLEENTKADYVAWEKDDNAKVASLVSEIKPPQFTLEADGIIRFLDPTTGDFINVSDVKASTGLTASVSAESNTCSTATTSNSTKTINSVKVSPVIEGTIIDYDDCVIKGDTGLIGKFNGIDIKLDEFVSKDEFYEIVENMKSRLDTKMDIKHYNNEKENNNMNMFKGFEFGKVDGNTVRMSMYGLAVKNQAGTWVSYNTATGEIMDVDVLNFNGEQFMYKMPVAIAQIAKGDMVIHNRKPVFVTNVCEDGKLVVIDIFDGEEKMILPTKNMFGFNFATKVVSLMDMAGMGKPTAENPFGNMWMLAMMGDGNDFDMKDMLMLSMMNGSNTQMNPMMMVAMMNKDSDNDMLMAMMLSGMMNPVKTN